MNLLSSLGLGAVLASSVAWAADDGEARKVAETYLNALTGAGDESGKELLLGGAKMDAQLFTLENWKVVGADPVRREAAELGPAIAEMDALDRAGQAATAKMAGGDGSSGDIEVTELTQEQAAQLLRPTKKKAERFVKNHPVLAFATRVGKDVYWHPKNPMRAVLKSAGQAGRYELIVHLFHIESREGPRKAARRWPLRILRFKTETIDTGWKVLPASDWSTD